MVLKLLQYQTEMLFVLFFVLRLDPYIIDEHYCNTPVFNSRNLVQIPL
jgi:hypothetical protein